MRGWKNVRPLWVGATLVTTSLSFPNVPVSLAQQSEQQAQPRSCLLEPGPRHSVVGIENSETLRLADGRKVRLLGILGPRAPLTSSNTAVWQPEREAREALKTLVEGREVTLAFDQRRQDRYGQWMAHVFAWHDGQRFWVQGEMLAHGHARAAVLPGTTACVAELIAHEHLARDPARGLWRHRHYRILKPNPAGWILSKRRHNFALISGKVADVAVVKSKIYLNFGRNWRKDFTAALPKRSLLGTATSLADIIALKGRRVSVRGWIERNNGPYMKLAHPGLIESLKPRITPSKDPLRDAPALAGASPEFQPHWRRKQRLRVPRIKRRTKKRPMPEGSKPEISGASKL